MISTKTAFASRAAFAAVLSVGLLSAAACNRSSTETADNGAAGASADAVDATPSTGETASNRAMSPSTSGATPPARSTSARASSETLTNPGSTATGDMTSAPPAPGTVRETIEQTKSGLSPAGASSGPTAPN